MLDKSLMNNKIGLLIYRSIRLVFSLFTDAIDNIDNTILHAIESLNSLLSQESRKVVSPSELNCKRCQGRSVNACKDWCQIEALQSIIASAHSLWIILDVK